ncbi:methylated-DNA--[protein]-cysteine S-methyltransferase [Candidatus Methylospira mobilis]|uniref:methylated-DNA--[protein]-cysteine S-methyltransferase n=1 Tax=Candidatus Methylospira mobilis TaxID=1808979 RepID=UPI001D177B89|nr:methylated-DNA--[protein]-cysteine S-methyltransferase [Candidatus Methylospira mobilis]WNV05165.1 methylated-DNA--[protein]-cysteine S-methyltransferase [Candidatus Methylospira mobilis]
MLGSVEAPVIGLDLPLDMDGTAFQQRVGQTLRQIRVGEKVSYSETAQRIGAPKEERRAVTGAYVAKTLVVAIPCHRGCVRSVNGLSGYCWGERKAELLRRERKA